MAIGFMSFGGMLTGGDDEEAAPVAQTTPVKDEINEAATVVVSTINKKEK